MNFKEFLETTGAFAGTAPSDGPSAGQPQSQSAQSSFSASPFADYVSNQERDGYFSNLASAYATGNQHQFKTLFDRAGSTGRYLNNSGGFNALSQWWQTVHDTLSQSSTRARTDKFVQRLNAALQNRDYETLYNLSSQSGDDGDTKMQRLGNGVRDADAILRFSSNAQHSDL